MIYSLGIILFITEIVFFNYSVPYLMLKSPIRTLAGFYLEGYQDYGQYWVQQICYCSYRQVHNIYFPSTREARLNFYQGSTSQQRHCYNLVGKCESELWRPPSKLHVEQYVPQYVCGHAMSMILYKDTPNIHVLCIWVCIV